jgi:hypothetical protein
MRNYRKTRKHGGMQFVPSVYTCAPGTDVEDCAQEFAASQGFQVIDTADDGNCFYDSLAKYGARTGNPATSKSHLALRREVVQYMLNNQALYEAYLLDDVPSPPDPPAGPVTARAAAAAAKAKAAHQRAITARLRGYLQPYTWAGGLGDVFPQVAAQILNLNITIYDVEANGNINMIAMGPGAGGIPSPGVPVVNLIRTNGNHFRLLWPAPAAAAPPVAPPRAPSPPKARAPSPPKARAPSPKPAARAPSPPKPATTAPRTTARRKPKVAPNAVNKLAENVKAMGVNNAGPRLTARQKAMMNAAVEKAAAAKAKKNAAPNNKQKRATARRQRAINLQAAELAKYAAAKKKNNSNSNNELAKAIQMSLYNV